jgi:hypothetical protein
LNQVELLEETNVEPIEWAPTNCCRKLENPRTLS